MDKRKIIITVAGIVILVLAFIGARLLSNGTGADSASAEKKTPQVAVRTQTVQNSTITSYIPLTGRVIPHEAVELYAEVTGVSTYGARPFKTGVAFKKGEVLLNIDDQEFRRSVISRKSQFMSLLSQVIPDLKIDFPEIYDPWKQYLEAFDIQQPMKPLPEAKTEQQRLFLSGRNVFSNYYSLKEAELRLSKYKIKAPYNGVLTEAMINQGTLVRVGQKLGEFIKTGIYELEASVSYQDMNYIKPGIDLQLMDVNGEEKYSARVTRVNEKVDPTTQMVKVFLTIKSPDLKSGVYLEGRLPKETYERAFEIPTDALLGGEHDEVFVVKEGKAALQPVEVVSPGENRSIVRGLDDGVVLIIDKKTKAFTGTPVAEALN